MVLVLYNILSIHLMLFTSGYQLRSISFALLSNQYSDNAKRKTTQLVPTLGRFIYQCSKKANQITPSLVQAGSEIFQHAIAGEDEICEHKQ